MCHRELVEIGRPPSGVGSSLPSLGSRVRTQVVGLAGGKHPHPQSHLTGGFPFCFVFKTLHISVSLQNSSTCSF